MPIPPPLPPKKLAWICLKTHAVLLHCVFVDGCGYTFTVDGQKSWWGVTGSGGRTAKCPPTRTKLNYAWPWQYHLSNVFLSSSWSNEYRVVFFFFFWQGEERNGSRNMSKPFNLKYLILYFLPTQSCSRLGTGQTTCALFAKGNQKLLDISFGTALIRIHSGNVLNHIILGCENN